LFTACKKDDGPLFDAQKALTDYLVAQNLDINTIIGGFVMMPPADGNLTAKHIIDIREPVDFAQGRIQGAVNVAWANVLNEAKNATKPILVVCYTGNTATYMVTLLRLAGYSDAKGLKWGMSSWHTTFANHAKGWNSHTGNIAVGHTNWTTAAAPTNLTYASPTFTSTSTDPVEILKARVEAVLAEGFKGVAPNAVLDSPQNYFINNYFPENHYLGFGHISGAYRIQPMLLGEGHVNFNDPSKAVVTYCYTGQTSGAISAFLRVIGYNAFSMTLGMNKLNHSSSTWGANRWGHGVDVPKDLPFVTP
jgi:rhodanese-related sulfurtransferase